MITKYLIINSVAGNTSTGKIAADLCRDLISNGNQCVLAYGRWVVNCDDIVTYRIGTDLDYRIHGIATRLFDKHGFGSKSATRRFIKWVKAYDPDVIWMHNLHGYYINIELLFDYLKKSNKIVKWTLHDCWSFTGHCSYFTIVNCEQWREACKRCVQLKRYPSCVGFGNVTNNYARKKAAFCGVSNLTIITPSRWLADLVKKSFLREYPVEVVPNKVDNTIFKPTYSDFRERFHVENKCMVLGVANGWGPHKGLKDFLQLNDMIDHKDYIIVLVGLKEDQLASIPDSIIGLPRTKNLEELAQIYTAADVLVSASREETFGMTPVEAKACGTPSIVYRDTACEEIALESGNMVVDQNPQAIFEALTHHNYRRNEK